MLAHTRRGARLAAAPCGPALPALLGAVRRARADPRLLCVPYPIPRAQVVALPEYRSWMARFSPATKHIVAAAGGGGGQAVMLSSALLQARPLRAVCGWGIQAYILTPDRPGGGPPLSVASRRARVSGARHCGSSGSQAVTVTHAVLRHAHCCRPDINLGPARPLAA